MADEPTILSEQADGRLAITLNRPAMANALRATDRTRLVELFEAASRNPDVRVVTIAARGRHFCAGMDLRSSNGAKAAVVPGYPGGLGIGMRNAQSLINAVLNCTKPVVAIVTGPAAGMGLYLALAADLIVASTEAAFLETFVQRGMVLHCGGAHLLVSRLGMQRAKEFVLRGGRLTAADADRYGLLAALSEPDELATTAEQIVSELAAGPTVALGLSKRLLNDAVGVERSRAFSDEEYAWELNSATLDRSEARDAFLAGRAPQFVGR